MKLYVLGDSISIQYGPYLEKHLQGVMGYSRKEGVEEALLNLDNPQGANGGDSSMVLSFLKARAMSGGIDADVILLNCGAHDLRTDPKTKEKQVPLEAYEKNLESVLQVVRKMKLRPVWVRCAPLDEKSHNLPERKLPFLRYEADVKAYNETADKVMRRAGVPIIDLHGFTLQCGSDLFYDHAHFHPHVREKQGAFIAGWLAGWIGREVEETI